MVTRRGDVVELSDEEMAELERLKVEIPAAYVRAADLFRGATLAEFRVADAEVGRLLRRWRELMGEAPL